MRLRLMLVGAVWSLNSVLDISCVLIMAGLECLGIEEQGLSGERKALRLTCEGTGEGFVL